MTNVKRNQKSLISIDKNKENVIDKGGFIMRITEKKENGFYELNNGQEIYGEENGIRLVQVLGKYEDIEELCKKIVSQPVYEKFVDTGEIHKEDYTEYHALYNFKERRIEVYGFEFINWFGLDEYGKTWALTREELENDR